MTIYGGALFTVPSAEPWSVWTCPWVPKLCPGPFIVRPGLFSFWTRSSAPRALNNICTLRPTFPSPCAVPQRFLLFWPLPWQGSSLFYAICCENKIIFPEKPSGPTQICCRCGKNPQAFASQGTEPRVAAASFSILFLLPPCAKLVTRSSHTF